jgi:hypothetical protein
VVSWKNGGGEAQFERIGRKEEDQMEGEKELRNRAQGTMEENREGNYIQRVRVECLVNW